VPVNIKNLINDRQCYQTVRELRWPNCIKCPACDSAQIIGFFEFVHNVRKRGKALLPALIELLVT
jgi:hypothetical protein